MKNLFFFIKVPRRLFALVALFDLLAVAGEEPAPAPGTLAARETELCTRNLKIIFESIQAYRKDHKELPNWLSDLVPQYLADSSFLTCPVTSRTGQTQTYGLSDPKLYTSYAYEFSAQQVPANRWGGSKLSMRQFKNLQMAMVGGDTPIIRCYMHTPRLNVGFNGRIYTSEQVWERRFAEVTPLEELSPARLLKGLGISQPEAEGPAAGLLEPASSVQQPDLRNVVGVVVSPDGNHVYAAAYNAASVVAFARDPVTGKLEHIQTINDPQYLGAAVSIRLNRDGRYAVVASFGSRTVSLFARDPSSGKLKLLDVARDGAGGVEGLNWVIHAEFTPDSKFVYAIASRSAAVTAFRLSDEKLHFIEASYGEKNCFQNVRGLAISPGGDSLYVVSSDANTLVVMDRDPNTGKTKVRQILTNEQNGVHGLAGAMQVICSSDGQFIYTSAGRFKGDNAIGIYKRNSDKTLALLKEVFNGQESLSGFEGGNGLALSKDGANLYALGSRSNAIIGFERDRHTGLLKYIQTIYNDEYGVGPLLAGAANLAVSPDGNQVYVGAEMNNALSIFQRAAAAAASISPALRK